LYKKIDELETSINQFFYHHNAFDFILEGSDLYIMTPFAVMKADITNVTKVRANYKVID